MEGFELSFPLPLHAVVDIAAKNRSVLRTRRRACPSLAGSVAQRADLLLPYHRATVDLIRRYKRDLGIGSLGSRRDFLIGNELTGRKARIEYDQDLLPQGVESITLDGIDHGKEV